MAVLRSRTTTANKALTQYKDDLDAGSGPGTAKIYSGTMAAVFAQHMRVTTTTERITVTQKPKREVQAPVAEAPKVAGKQGSKYVYVATSTPQYNVQTSPDEILVRTNKETIGGN